jgi:hypothetical protein
MRERGRLPVALRGVWAMGNNLVGSEGNIVFGYGAFMSGIAKENHNTMSELLLSDGVRRHRGLDRLRGSGRADEAWAFVIFSKILSAVTYPIGGHWAQAAVRWAARSRTSPFRSSCTRGLTERGRLRAAWTPQGQVHRERRSKAHSRLESLRRGAGKLHPPSCQVRCRSWRRSAQVESAQREGGPALPAD